jgi:hypothetical protein
MKWNKEDVGTLCPDPKTLGCDGVLVLDKHKPNFKPKTKSHYYYNSWLSCPVCRSQFFINSEMVLTKKSPLLNSPISDKRNVAN